MNIRELLIQEIAFQLSNIHRWDYDTRRMLGLAMATVLHAIAQPIVELREACQAAHKLIVENCCAPELESLIWKLERAMSE